MAEPTTLVPSPLSDRAARVVFKLPTCQSHPRLAVQLCTVLPRAPSPAPRSKMDRCRHSLWRMSFGKRFRKGSAKSKKRFTLPKELKNSATSSVGRSESKYSSCVFRRGKNMLVLYGLLG